MIVVAWLMVARLMVVAEVPLPTTTRSEDAVVVRDEDRLVVRDPPDEVDATEDVADAEPGPVEEEPVVEVVLPVSLLSVVVDSVEAALAVSLLLVD